MADVVDVLPDSPHYIAVHDLHVVNVEQQLHSRGIDALDQVDAVVDVVAVIARMALHRMRVVAGVEVFEAQVHALLFGQRDHLFPAFHAVLVGLFVAHTRRMPVKVITFGAPTSAARWIASRSLSTQNCRFSRLSGPVLKPCPPLTSAICIPFCLISG